MITKKMFKFTNVLFFLFPNTETWATTSIENIGQYRQIIRLNHAEIAGSL